MKFLAHKRYLFSGMLWIPKVDVNDPQGRSELVYEKDIFFDFSGDKNAPRSVMYAVEAYPTTAVVTRIRNRYQDEILPQAEFTITSVEPVLNPLGKVEVFKHTLALKNQPDFGYEITRA